MHSCRDKLVSNDTTNQAVARLRKSGPGLHKQHFSVLLNGLGNEAFFEARVIHAGQKGFVKELESISARESEQDP
jgi:hypothetical protein